MATVSLGDVCRMPEVEKLVESVSVCQDEESVISKDDTVRIILATLRLYGCRGGTFASAYAWEAFAEAIGEERAKYAVRHHEQINPPAA